MRGVLLREHQAMSEASEVSSWNVLATSQVSHAMILM